ncbi:hypothetical protein [Nonomuraea sp. NPDC049400]|uniref:hypothetical protein n=1 Tax=Nonomuraea sp. NPDC049400 TaxID=3364352 RepID=UPI00378C0C09
MSDRVPGLVVEAKRFRPVHFQRHADQVRAEAEDIVQLIVPIHGTVSATWAAEGETPRAWASCACTTLPGSRT